MTHWNNTIILNDIVITATNDKKIDVCFKWKNKIQTG